jgi:CRP-like cAMP-binding protein
MNQLLASLGVSRQFAKGSMLLRQGERESNLFLIQEGLTKAYYQTRDGKVFIKSFITAGDVIGSLQALIDDKACAFSLMALEQTRALVINKSQLASLMDFQSELAAPSLEFINLLKQRAARI